MTLAYSDKQQIVEATRATVEDSVSAVVTDYRGMTVEQLTVMRKQARENNVELKVVRNTLARLALKDTDHECLTADISGPTMFAFSTGDPGAGARLIKETLKNGTHLEVRAISVSGTYCSGDQLDAIASLPTRDEAIAQLMSVILGPVTKLAQVLNAVPTKLVRTVDRFGQVKSLVNPSI